MTEWYQDEDFVKWVRATHYNTTDGRWDSVVKAGAEYSMQYAPLWVEWHRQCTLMYTAWEASRTLAVAQEMKAVDLRVEDV